MTEAVHFIAVIGERGDAAACGQWEPTNMSGNHKHVTCGSCKRTRRYRAAERGERLYMRSYRKGSCHAE